MDWTVEVVMTRPTAFEVSYVINPWMQPDEWRQSPELLRWRAQSSWQQLFDNLCSHGVTVHLVDAVTGLPDLTFPANAAVVFDRRVLLSRFASKERRKEEPVFQTFFRQLQQRGIVDDVTPLPKSVIQEGAGDCLWDTHRGFFWSGFGQRSSREGADAIATYFARNVVSLELVNPLFYHLDVALAVLEHGELLYFPDAFSAHSLATIRSLVADENRLEINAEDAAAFCANIVSLNDTLFMTPPSEQLRRRLQERGYKLCEIDLLPFLLSGGAAACLTLRLDHQRDPQTLSHRGGKQNAGNQ